MVPQINYVLNPQGQPIFVQLSWCTDAFFVFRLQGDNVIRLCIMILNLLLKTML
jgi:hypothetical protein